MEAVLQWIDEAEDLFFAGVFLWQRAIRCCLTVGFVASLVLVFCRFFFMSFAWVFTLTGVAMSSVSLWLLAALAALIGSHGAAALTARA